LIDFVDFERDGNSFLRTIGVSEKPSASILAKLLLDRQASFFENRKRREGDKTRVYLECLKRLASDVNSPYTISDYALLERLRNEPWCLGFTYTDDNDSEKTFQIAVPREIYLIDDPTNASYFRPLSPPVSPKLEELYKMFGSRWLRDCIKTKFIFKGIIISI
jgi:hypothetical protein